MQVLEGQQSGDEQADDHLNDRDHIDEVTAIPIPTKPTGWDLRKPDKMTASKLKTGYEGII